MVPLPSHELALDEFIALVPDETIQRFDDGPQVVALGQAVDVTLALGRAIVIVRALEDEAETLRNKANLSTLAPAQQIECNLPKAVILGHVVHCTPPAIHGVAEGLFGSGALVGTTPGSKAVESRILELSDDIVKIELGGKVPFTVVGLLSTDVVGVKS